MADIHQPRHGSMQYWPRKKARRQYPLVRSWAEKKDANLLGFAGYKAGMSHIIIIDNKKTSKTKGQELRLPVTVVECPPLKVAALIAYKKDAYGTKAFKTILASKLDKALGRKIILPKTEKAVSFEELDKSAHSLSDVKLLVYTQPRLTMIGQKRPELFEMGIGGKNVSEKLAFAKEHLGKDIPLEKVFKDGAIVDIHAVTKGKGNQGPVKRFGIALKNQKSEKGRRRPGSLGPWKGQAHVMYRVAMAGQMGYHTRTEWNKQILRISSKPEDINPKGDFIRYGKIQNTYVLFKGSIAGPAKRIIRFNAATRNYKHSEEAPTIDFVSTSSKQ